MSEQGELLAASDLGPNPPAHRNAMQPASPQAQAAVAEARAALAPPIAGLNEAKAAAAANGTKAVMFLAEVFTGEEYDVQERVTAAAELLQFLAKGPF